MYREGSQYHLYLVCYMRPYGEAVLTGDRKNRGPLGLRKSIMRSMQTQQTVSLSVAQ